MRSDSPASAGLACVAFVEPGEGCEKCERGKTNSAGKGTRPLEKPHSAEKNARHCLAGEGNETSHSAPARSEGDGARSRFASRRRQRAKNTQTYTRSDSEHGVVSFSKTRLCTDTGIAEVLLNKKKKKKKSNVKNILLLYYKLKENPVISLCSNFSQSEASRQKNKSTERDKVSRWP